MKKRLLSSILALTLCLGLTVPAFAKDLENAGKQDILNTFTICRNGSVDEKAGDYCVNTPFKLLELEYYPIEKEGYSVISEDDAWTISNTGSKELSASGNPDYELLIRLYTYHHEEGANDEYVFRGSCAWSGENRFSSSDPEAVLLKAGESVTIPASAFITADGSEADSGTVYELYIDVRYQGVFDDWQYYKRYYSDIQRVQRSCSFYFRIDEARKAQIDSTGPETSAEPVTPGEPAFTDVPGWCAAAVDWAVEKGVTNGTNDGSNGRPKTFSPDEKCTQAQILTFLYRAAGEPEVEGELPFTVADAYRNAILWAADEDMIGLDGFNPEAPCTRSSTMRFIWQAFDSPKAEATGFDDVDEDEDYAGAVSWAVKNGVTNGTNDGSNGQPKTFGPGETCTRGQIVTFLHRAYVPEVRVK